ncbi:MAG: hypothetical protein L0H93_12105 [Nocardioides sp.]|nr:hypothetical protein [Nocardioides sp.]
MEPATAPLLAVETLWHSTRLVDLNLKRAPDERAEVTTYWVIHGTRDS